MTIKNQVSPSTLKKARHLFAYASISTDRELQDFMMSIIVKPMIIAFLAGFCLAIVACIALRGAS